LLAPLAGRIYDPAPQQNAFPLGVKTSSLVDSKDGGPMPFEFTAIFQEAPEGGYVAFVEELPGANTQGETLDEARENLREAVSLVLESNRLLAKQELGGAKVIRERLRLPA
jgi:predicted RNase H-like HicB family nuclease